MRIRATALRRRVSRVLRSARLVTLRGATMMAVGSPILTPSLLVQALTVMAVAFTFACWTRKASKYGFLSALRSPRTSFLAALTHLPGRLPKLSGLAPPATRLATFLIIALSLTPRSVVTGPGRSMETLVAQGHAPRRWPKHQTSTVRFIFHALALDSRSVLNEKADAYWEINYVDVYISSD